jgi:hypothetical protein
MKKHSMESSFARHSPKRIRNTERRPSLSLLCQARGLPVAILTLLLVGCSLWPRGSGEVIVIDNKCILPPSPVGTKYETQLKASLDVVKKSAELGATFKGEGQKLLEINEELVKLYALGTFCLKSEGLSQEAQDALRKNINALVQDIAKQPAPKEAAPALPESGAILEKLPVTPGFTSDVKLELRTLVISAGLSLSLSETNLRANVFMLGKDGKHRIADDLTYNMFTVSDRTIAIPRGFGSTGVAFSMNELVASFLKLQKAYVIRLGVVYPIESREPFVLPVEEQAKVDPNLVWIFSAPLTDESSRAIIGVMNLSCTGSACESVKPEDLAKSVEREMRIRGARIASLLETQLKTAKKP